MADKEATVYIVDVARSMSKSNQSRDQSDLDWALQYVWDKITNTVSTGRKTAQIGVIGLGTDKTHNDMMAEEPYKHISVITPIQQILMPELQRLPTLLVPSNTDTRDGLSAIIIAVDVIMKHCKHLKFRKKIILITNGTGTIDDDDIDDTAQQIKDNGIELVVLGIDFDDAELGFQEKNKSATKQRNEGTLRRLVDACGGMLGTMQEAIDGLARPEMKATRPTPTYRGQLRLGDPQNYETALTIDVERYFKVSIRRPPTASAFAMKTGQSQQGGGLNAIHNEFNYSVIDKTRPGDKKQLNREDLAKGYEYGRTAVHISETDENITKLETEAGYEIMGFIPADNVERYMIIDNTNMLVAQKGNDKAALALSSLVQGLFIQESVAVARFVKKDMSEPALMLLSPLVEADIECLIENVLPFAEDIRTYRFPPLDKVLTVSGKTLTSHRNLPNKDLMSSMSDFVDSMVLVNDEDEEMLAMDDTFSPVLHTVESAIRHRAIYPDQPVPPKAEAYLAYSKQPGELRDVSQHALERLVKAAEVKKVPPKVKGRKKYREAEKPISGLDVESLFRKERRTKISPDNAIPEFKQALDATEDMDSVKEAVRQMSVIIEEWTKSSFGDQNYDRAIEGLGIMRNETYFLEMPELYNDVLRSLKEKVLKEKLNGNRRDFWSKFRYASPGIGLIHKDEKDSVSSVTREEAERFLIPN